MTSQRHEVCQVLGHRGRLQQQILNKTMRKIVVEKYVSAMNAFQWTYALSSLLQQVLLYYLR